MDSLARNALRLSLAGAGLAVLGAGFVGQASAAELPEAPSAPEAPDTSLVTDNLPPTADNDVDVKPDAGETPQLPGAESLPAHDKLSQLPGADKLPSAESVPSLDNVSTFQVPGTMNIEAPTVGS